MHIKRVMHIKKWCMYLNKERIFLRRSYLRELGFDIIISYVVAYTYTVKPVYYLLTFCMWYDLHCSMVTTNKFRCDGWPRIGPICSKLCSVFFFHQFCSRRNTWHVTHKKGTCLSSRGTSVLLWFLVQYVMLSL